MAIAWEGIEVAARRSRELVASAPEHNEGDDEQFQLQFRVLLAEAMVRVAESDLKWHREQAHFVRSFLAQRKVTRRKKALLHAIEIESVPEAPEPQVVAAAPAVIEPARFEPVPWYRQTGRSPQPDLSLEAGDRVVTYLELGVRNGRHVRNVRIVRRR
jgi:hypothetical protein